MENTLFETPEFKSDLEAGMKAIEKQLQLVGIDDIPTILNNVLKIGFKIGYSYGHSQGKADMEREIAQDEGYTDPLANQDDWFLTASADEIENWLEQSKPFSPVGIKPTPISSGDSGYYQY